MSTLATTNIKHPSSASNNIVLDASGNVVLQAGSASTPALQPSGDTNTGIFFPAADTIAFAEGGVESMRIDSSSRLLVGTSTSIANDWWGNGQIQAVSGNGSGQGNISITTFNNGVNAALYPASLEFHKARGTQASPTTVADGDQIGELAFFGYNSAAATPFQRAAIIRVEVDGAPSSAGDTTDMPGRLVFSTTADGASSPTARLRINNVGTSAIFSTITGGATALDIAASAAAGTTNFLIYGNHSASDFGGGTNAFRVYTNGNIQNTNGSYTTLSDAKLKENIVDAGSQWDDLKAIQIRNWNFKAETGHETHRQIGPIAQELEAVCPGLVFETPDRDEDGNETGEVTKGVNQSVLYMKAVKALQEAMERIEQLEAKVTALEAA